MKLYIDDIRDAPDESWTLVRTISEAIRFIDRYSHEIKEISLDHDISYEVRIEGVYRPFPSPETYQPVAHFIAEKYLCRMLMQELPGNGLPPWRDLKVTLHTANSVGAQNMKEILSPFIEVEIKPMGAAHRPK